MRKSMTRLLGGLGLLAVVVAASLALLSGSGAEAAGPGGPPCGGLAGLDCPSPRQICVDDPRDNCDPRTGGRDCIGLCRGRGAG